MVSCMIWYHSTYCILAQSFTKAIWQYLTPIFSICVCLQWLLYQNTAVRMLAHQKLGFHSSGREYSEIGVWTWLTSHKNSLTGVKAEHSPMWFCHIMCLNQFFLMFCRLFFYHDCFVFLFLTFLFFKENFTVK